MNKDETLSTNNIIPFNQNPSNLFTGMVSLLSKIITSQVSDSELCYVHVLKRIIPIFEFVLITPVLTLAESFSVIAK